MQAPQLPHGPRKTRAVFGGRTTSPQCGIESFFYLLDLEHKLPDYFPTALEKLEQCLEVPTISNSSSVWRLKLEQCLEVHPIHQNVVFNRLDSDHKSPDSGERQYKWRARTRRFDPALRADPVQAPQLPDGPRKTRAVFGGSHHPLLEQCLEIKTGAVFGGSHHPSNRRF